MKKPEPNEINFTVDAALLKELGERLVGRPHIAVAELVKNSYDADAELSLIQIEKDRIVVEDNGHGMTEKQFRDFWMRIGSPHKTKQGTSPKYDRRLTGSKGVGRLAVQFLGANVSVTTTAESKGAETLHATVDWSQADRKGDLTSVVAKFHKSNEVESYADGSAHGTRITITSLNHDWDDADRAEELANALWDLRSPIPLGTAAQEGDFDITLKSSIPKARDKFLDRVQAPLDLWYALLRGELIRSGKEKLPSKLQVTLVFKDEDRQPLVQLFDLPDAALSTMSFEVRVYSLYGRLDNGIAVQKARDYIMMHGGIKIFDAGFRLPYYGLENDWLNIERDHSHRTNESKVLPKALQVQGGLVDLPTQTRLLGFVNVDTGKEAAATAGVIKRVDRLQIQVSRDRLVDNRALAQLVRCVRLAIDWYAMRQAVRKSNDAARELERLDSSSEKLRSISQIISSYEKYLPKQEGRRLLSEIDKVVKVEQASQEVLGQNLNLLGALATAGIFALSFEHEIGRQLSVLEGLGARIEALGPKGKELAEEFQAWVARVRETRSIFTSLSEDESRRTRQRYVARDAIVQFARQATPFLAGAQISMDRLDDDIRLPRGSFAEWSAVFQNVFANAANAMLDSRKKLIDISSRNTSATQSILIQDTGFGIDLREAHRYFEAFERHAPISRERRALAVGGTGLGLTIVRTIASNLNCTVSFEEPERGFSTCFRLSWHR